MHKTRTRTPLALCSVNKLFIDYTMWTAILFDVLEKNTSGNLILKAD